MARFNYASALALQGLPSAAVSQLQHLPATAELRDKIAGDSDFDAIREHPAWVDFVQTLPE